MVDRGTEHCLERTFFSSVMEISIAEQLCLWAVKCCSQGRRLFSLSLIKTWVFQSLTSFLLLLCKIIGMEIIRAI